MEIEKVSPFTVNSDIELSEMESCIEKTMNLVKAIPWEGGARDEFFNDFLNFYNRFLQLLDNGRQNNLRVKREMDEWFTVDQRGVEGLASVAAAVTGFGRYLGDSFNSYWLSFTRKNYEESFSTWWDEQSQEEKENFLQEQAKIIAKDLGIEPMEMHFVQINDPEGKDAQGYYDGTGIYLDVDNLSNDKPWNLLNTIAHETRHAYQDNAVDVFIETGKPPEGISKATVERWKDNFADYIEPGDDFEDYRGQPIEVDARQYGKNYSDRVLIDQPWKED
jgi:hypothetical protein